MNSVSLKTRLIALVFVIVLFFGLINTFIVYFKTKQIVLEQNNNEIELLTKTKAKYFERIFNSHKDIAQTISENEDIIKYLQNKREAVDNNVLEILNGYNIAEAFSAIYLMDKEGITRISTDPDFVGQNYSFRNYFNKSINGEPYIDVLLGVTSKKLGYYFSYPITDNNGRILGVMVLKMKPEVIDNAILDNRDNDDQELLLTDENGIVINSTNNEYRYFSLGRMIEKQKINIEKTQKYGNTTVKSLGYNRIQEELFKISDYRAIIGNDEINSKANYLISVAQIDGLPFYLAIEQDMGKIISNVNTLSLTVSITVLISAIIILFLLSYAISSSLIPINELTEIVKSFTNGNMRGRMIVSSNDEIGTLANSFNLMADKIVKNQKDIEKKVKNRTMELNKLNKYLVGRELKMLDLKKRIEYLEKDGNATIDEKNDKN